MRRPGLVVLFVLALVFSGSAWAHPLGNFSISQVSLVSFNKDAIQISYILDFAEIPSLQLFPKNNVEEAASVFGATWASGLTLWIDAKKVPLQLKDVRARQSPGEGGLSTIRVVTLLETEWQPRNATIEYRDTNFEDRIGWKNIVVITDGSTGFPGGNRYPMDPTNGLSEYPTDALTEIPAIRHAVFRVEPADGGGSPSAIFRGAIDTLLAPRAKKGGAEADPMTQLLGSSELPLRIIILGLLVAFSLGALHALSPGHGKTIVAAYLVGNRGTARHAVFLGAVVTFTHTIGVFALGLLTLFASQYFVPERLYPWMGLVSGVMIVAIGLALLRQRLGKFRKMERGESGEETHSHGGIEHSHDGSRTPHSHEIPNQITLKTLLTLGVSGGIIPCPSALVVLLSAVAIHRIQLGLLMIVSFSLGLAGVLVAIGLLVVQAKSYLRRFRVNETLLAALPVLSAILITVIGLSVSAGSLEGLSP